MANRPPSLKMEAFDMDSLFDFNQSTTQPSSASLTATPSTAVSPYDKEQERQQFNGPSHDYNLHKQQVGLPVGSMASMPAHGGYDGYGSGMGGDMGGFGWSSGIDFDTDMNMDFNSPQSAMPAMFFPTQSNESPSDAFIDPSNIGGQEEPTSNVGRLWPGMHSQQAQQAAMQKAAQTQVMQQRQMKLQAQHAQYRQVGNTVPSHPPQQQQPQGHAHGHAKRPSHASEPHVEESISRLLSQMRQNSNASVDDDEGSPNSMLPHIARMKKDEEEMDEDERLLASEEGKKLSSKERRQLRNKVSARAFRSRRKEYIGQLEGEVAIKAQENTDLRSQNSALLQENDRYRTLIETLLRHPAFTPFINDISKDPSVLGPPQQQQQQQPPQQQQQHQHQAPQQQQQPQQPPPDSKPDFMNFDASQLQIPNMQQPQQQQQNERVGLAMIPENDFSKLRLSGFNNHSANYSNAYNVNAYPILEVPEGPNPADLLAQSTSDMSDMLAQLDGAARKVRWAEMAGH